jgi:hypothetical protein
MWLNRDFQRIEERRRNDNLRSKRHENAMRRYEADLADREQSRVERKERLELDIERWDLEKKEREARLAYLLWRERIEIGTNLACLILSIAVVIAGIHSGQVVLGGSGAVSLFWVRWMLHSSLSRRRESPA